MGNVLDSSYTSYLQGQLNEKRAERKKKDDELMETIQKRDKLKTINEAIDTMNKKIDDAISELDKAKTYAGNAKDSFVKGYVSKNINLTNFDNLENDIESIKKGLTSAKAKANKEKGKNQQDISRYARNIEKLRSEIKSIDNEIISLNSQLNNPYTLNSNI